MTTPIPYATFTYGLGPYGGAYQDVPYVDVEMSAAEINVNLETASIDMELTV